MSDEVAFERLPRLVARYPDSSEIDFLIGAALASRTVYVPLIAPPANASVHALEVHARGNGEPVFLIAEPLGPPDANGYPLRLRMPVRPPSSKPPHSAATLQEITPDGPPHPVSVQAVEAAKDPFVGRQLAGGKLVIEACVGEGGAGSVYRARHRDLQMPVAVKVMHEGYQRDRDYCQRFQAEALSASRLDHPNLTRVLDFGQEPDGLLYIAMEFLDGKSLRDVLDAEKTMSFERASQIMIQVCSGLTHAHARSIVHRDIKPENIMLVRGLDEDGQDNEIVKICDFGIAHREEAGTPAVFAGTAEYISPEQYGGAEPDVQSDVYACGVVLYELLTGVVPIQGEFPAIVPLVLSNTPKPPSHHVPGLDARVDRLVMKALAKDRAMRHTNTRELRAQLKQVAEEMALFSAGGYLGGAGGSTPASNQPAVQRDAGTPDWLERGGGYMSSMMPKPPSSAPPPSVRVAPNLMNPASSGPGAPSSKRSPMQPDGLPSISSPSRPGMPALRTVSPYPEGPPSIRTAQLSIASLPPTRHPSSGTHPAASAMTPIMAGSHVSMTPATSEADEVTRAVASFVPNLIATTDKDKFAAMVSNLGPKIRSMIEQGHLAATWKLASALALIAGEAPGPGSRAEHASRVLEVFSERALLVKLAERALDAIEDKDGIARKMVIRAGNAGAHALYSARVKNSVFDARERFVTTLQAIGEAALPTLRSALERLESRLTVPGALWIAEDLLKAVPNLRDDELGQILLRYTKSEAVSLAALATGALLNTCGPKARSILVAQMHHKEDDVVIVAIKNLRQLGGIDPEILGHLRPLVLGGAGARPRVRLAATEALVDATQDALPAARTLLAETLATTQGTTPDVEDMIVTVSKTMVAVQADVTLIAARWRESTGFLRTRLETILRQARG